MPNHFPEITPKTPSRSGSLNLVAHEKTSGEHRFTWQPHGSQFTIVETVPGKRLCVRLKQPPELDRDKVLATMNFTPAWVEVFETMG